LQRPPERERQGRHTLVRARTELAHGVGLEGAAALAWLDGRAFKERREIAVDARIAGLVTGEDWYGEPCALDRALVLQTCPKGFDPATWEQFVELFAEERRCDPRFIAGLGGPSGELVRQPHEVMPVARAIQIIEKRLCAIQRVAPETSGPGHDGN
jgi:hypothetical protein